MSHYRSCIEQLLSKHEGQDILKGELVLFEEAPALGKMTFKVKGKRILLTEDSEFLRELEEMFGEAFCITDVWDSWRPIPQYGLVTFWVSIPKASLEV